MERKLTVISAVHCGQRCPLDVSTEWDLLMMDSRVCSSTSRRLSTIISTSSWTEESWDTESRHREAETHWVNNWDVNMLLHGKTPVCSSYRCITVIRNNMLLSSNGFFSQMCVWNTKYFTIELVLIIEKMLVRIPEQMSSSLCWRRCRWIWCRTTGSKILRDSE